MRGKNPPDNVKDHIKSTFRLSLWIFVIVLILSFIYEVWHDEIAPVLEEYAPMVYHVLEASQEGGMEIQEVKKP